MERPVTTPTALLLHAFPCDHRMWRAQAAGLRADGWRVLAPDLPGFGGTALPDAEPGLDSVARVVLDLLDAEGVESALLGGLSLGGYVAMALLRMAPERFPAVMLCDTKASADAETARENRLRLAAAVSGDPASCGRILRQSVLPGLLGPTTFEQRPQVVAEVGGWLDEAAPATVAWYQRAMAARPDSFATLQAVRGPALVLWGEEDALSPDADQQAMIEALAQPVAERLAGSGHLSSVEVPEAATEAIRRFAASLPSQA